MQQKKIMLLILIIIHNDLLISRYLKQHKTIIKNNKRNGTTEITNNKTNYNNNPPSKDHKIPNKLIIKPSRIKRLINYLKHNKLVVWYMNLVYSLYRIYATTTKYIKKFYKIILYKILKKKKTNKSKKKSKDFIKNKFYITSESNHQSSSTNITLKDMENWEAREEKVMIISLGLGIVIFFSLAIIIINIIFNKLNAIKQPTYKIFDGDIFSTDNNGVSDDYEQHVQDIESKELILIKQDENTTYQLFFKNKPINNKFKNLPSRTNYLFNYCNQFNGFQSNINNIFMNNINNIKSFYLKSLLMDNDNNNFTSNILKNINYYYNICNILEDYKNFFEKDKIFDPKLLSLYLHKLSHGIKSNDFSQRRIFQNVQVKKVENQYHKVLSDFFNLNKSNKETIIDELNYTFSYDLINELSEDVHNIFPFFITKEQWVKSYKKKFYNSLNILKKKLEKDLLIKDYKISVFKNKINKKYSLEEFFRKVIPWNVHGASNDILSLSSYNDLYSRFQNKNIQ